MYRTRPGRRHRRLIYVRLFFYLFRFVDRSGLRRESDQAQHQHFEANRFVRADKEVMPTLQYDLIVQLYFLWRPGVGITLQQICGKILCVGQRWIALE